MPALISLSVFFIALGIVLFVVFIFDKHYFNFSFEIDTHLASEFGSFFQGLVGTVFAIAGAFLIALTFLYQGLTAKKAQIENILFKMLDYHRDNVCNIRIKDYRQFAKRTADRVEGSRAFVVFKLQLFDVLRIVQDLNERFKLGQSLSKKST